MIIFGLNPRGYTNSTLPFAFIEELFTCIEQFAFYSTISLRPSTHGSLERRWPSTTISSFSRTGVSGRAWPTSASRAGLEQELPSIHLQQQDFYGSSLIYCSNWHFLWSLLSSYSFGVYWPFHTLIP